MTFVFVSQCSIQYFVSNLNSKFKYWIQNSKFKIQLKLNQNSNTEIQIFSSPVCRAAAPISSLYIDSYFREILEKCADNDDDKVVVEADGSYSRLPDADNDSSSDDDAGLCLIDWAIWKKIKIQFSIFNFLTSIQI